MPLPRVFAVGLWLAVTVASTAMTWMATSTVAADVTDRPAPVLAHQDVVSELESGSTLATTPSTITLPKAATSTSAVPAPGRTPVPAGRDASEAAAPPPRAPQPAVTIPPFSPTTTAPPPEASPDTLSPGPPAAPAPPRPMATYSTTGGVVRVACNGIFIDLISAIPNNGYAVEVTTGGPVNVEVHFVRSGQDLSVKAVCFGRPIRYYDQGPPPSEAPPGPA